MAKALSSFCIRDIFLGGQELNFNEYIVQIIKIKDFGKEKKNVRYRLSISDGQYSIIVMINHSLVSQMKCELELYDILRIQGYVKNVISGHIILALTQKPDCIYTCLKEIIGLGQDIKNINQVDKEIVKYYKENIDQSKYNLFILKLLYTPKRKQKGRDYFQEIKDHRKTLVKEVFEGSFSTGNESSTDSKEFTSVSKLQYSAKNWKIKVRVTKRSALNHFNSNKNSGYFLNAELVDSSRNQILANFFNSAAEKFDSILKEKETYIMSGGKITLSKNCHSSIENKYSINFPSDAVITKVVDDGTIPKFSYNFTPFIKAHAAEDGKLIDVIGIVHTFKESIQIQNNNGKSITKREIILVDDSGIQICVGFWGAFEFLKKLEENPHQIIVIKQAKVRTFSGVKNLNCYEGAIIELNPDIPKAEELMKWFVENLKNELEMKEMEAKNHILCGLIYTNFYLTLKLIKPYKNRSEEKSSEKRTKDETLFVKEILTSVNAEHEFSDGKIKCSGYSELFDGEDTYDGCQIKYISVHGYIDNQSSYIDDKIIYLCCPNQTCKKKVFEKDGKYRCDGCKETYQKCRAKYNLVINVCDGSDRMLQLIL